MLKYKEALINSLEADKRTKGEKNTTQQSKEIESRGLIANSQNPDAISARAILSKYGIDKNDAINGVFLPTKKGVSNAAYHPSLHTNKYYEKVNLELKKATSKEDVEKILSSIATLLLNNSF